MSNVLPLEKAYGFGKNKGYHSDMVIIKSLKKPEGWDKLGVGPFPRVRRWKVKVLFEQKGIWEEFKHLHWAEGNNRGAQNFLNKCQKAANAYDAAQQGTGPENTVLVRFPVDKMKKLKDKAEEFGIDASTLAQIWISGYLI